MYAVPDAVADQLEKYCLDFCTKWIRTSPQAKKYRRGNRICYDQSDFIEYLNLYLFPEEPSKELMNLGWTNLGKDLPEEFRPLPCFNF